MTETKLIESAAEEFARAEAALAAGGTVTAMSHCERALQLHDFPGWYSFLGYCIAKERGQKRQGIELCRQALTAEPDNPAHFLNLARIHLLNNDKEAALLVLREGTAKGGSLELAEFLRRLGKRNPPIFSMLSRSNPLNKYLGILLTRLGRR